MNMTNHNRKFVRHRAAVPALLGAVLLSFVHGQSVDLGKIDLEALKSNLRYLASPELEGRESGTAANRTAARFLAGKLESYGLKAFGDDGTYFQNIPAEIAGFSPETRLAIVAADGTTMKTGKWGDDFLLYSQYRPNAGRPSTPREMVFVRFGIAVPERSYDDYESLDVKGKIVVALDGVPTGPEGEYFGTPQGLGHGDANRKLQTAVGKGAAGLLLLPAENVLQAWNVMKPSSLRRSIRIVVGPPGQTTPGPGSETPDPFFLAFIKDDLAGPLFKGEEWSPDGLRAAARENRLPASFRLRSRARLEPEGSVEKTALTNVVGIIEGRDPQLKGEQIVVCAHYDHIARPADSFDPGADDNASGTVAAMEIGRLLAAEKTNRRPVVIVLVDGEEKGLLGSRSFAAGYGEGGRIAAAIVFDMVGREDPRTISCVGPRISSSALEALFVEADRAIPDLEIDWTADRIGIRGNMDSDHASFLERGIPAAVLNDRNRNVHTPDDTPDKIDFEKISKVVRLAARVALAAANGDVRPEFKRD